ncbi:hypothetical protein [Inhella sp.]|uniref:hypothetical protein n=1 Tax=Inhella sp. TaxID=1921806 RepID=UPI0035AD8A8B
MSATLNARLKDFWQRFQARPRRERAMLLAGAAALLLVLGDRLWIGPAWSERQAARSQAQQVADALAETERTLQTQAQALVQRRQAETQERDQLHAQLQQLRAASPASVSPERALALLESVVARQQGRVQLLALTALPDAGTGPVGLATPSTPAASGASAPPRVFRHGLQLVVQGSYADLHAYLRDLGREPQLRLRGFELAVRQHPQLELSLQVETLSLHPEWLTL